MNQQQKEQLDQQKTIWNKYSDGWEKWNDLMTTAMSPITNKLIELLKLKGHEHILDVASGPGEPGLTLSKMLPEGKVTAVDLSEEMVRIANTHAQQLGITNYQSSISDASDMPFEDNHFDHIICRFGIMFFPDIKAGLQEMVRVLKHHGKLTVIVWAVPELNPFLSLIGRIIMEKLRLPQSSPDSPGIFRCAKPGIARQLLIDEGLMSVSDMNIQGLITYDSLEEFWELSWDVAGPMMEALKKSPPWVIEEVKTSVFDKAENFIKEGKVQLNWEAILATGIKK